MFLARISCKLASLTPADATASRRRASLPEGIVPSSWSFFRGSCMSVQAAIASLSTLALLVACGHHAAPAPAAELGRDPPCLRPDTAHRDSGIALGNDISRGPRYRVDSAGRV